jgi:hypothetical protein
MSVVVKVILGLAFAYVVLRLGFWMLRGLANPLPAPPPSGELRRVNLRYRCSMCGVELRMTAAPDEEPPPPRHCQEDMDLVASPDD